LVARHSSYWARRLVLIVAALTGAQVFFGARPAIAQFSATIDISPGGGSYPVGYHVAIHVDFCATEGFFDGGGAVYQNDVPVAGSVSGSRPGCSAYASADFTATLEEGLNTIRAVICGNPDCGEAVVGFTTPADPPVIDLTPHNGYNRNASLCVAACFNTVTSYTTPAYWTLDAPRAVTLFYSSGQVESRHTVEFVATNQASVEPNQITARLRRPDGSYVTLVTGGTLVSFTPPGPGPHRYALQFEDSTLATGAYDYSLVVAGDWGTGVSETSVPIRVLVINERASPYGAGWSVAGVQRIILGPGDSLATWDGTGTIQFWRLTSCVGTTCTYAAPPGEFDQLQRLGTAPNFSYVRTMVDGTRSTFGVFGQLLSVSDVFNNQMQVKWKQSDVQRIDTIIDPAGKKIAFTYDGNNRLASIRDLPGNRTTSFSVSAQNNLTQIQDPVGGKPFQQATYDAFHRLLARLDRRGARWASSYDVAGKVATDSTPPVTVDGVSQRLVTVYRSFEAGALSATDSGGIGTVTPAVGSARKVRVDAFGALLEVLTPATEFSLYERNAHSQITQAWDSTGHRVLTWNGPRLIQTADVITGKVVNVEWNTATNRVTRQYGNGTVEVRNFYDVGGYRLDSTRVGNEPATRLTYDSRGRVVTATDPKGHVTRSFYDGNPWLNTDSVKMNSRRTAYLYDGLAGRPSVVRNPGGRIDSTFYDALNRPSRTGGPLGYAVAYTYGDSVNLTAITDARGHTRGAAKNALGWDTLTVGAVNDTSRFSYDKAGHVLRSTNRRGQVTQFDYDSIGRLTSRMLSDGRITNVLYASMRTVVVNEEGSDTVRWSGDTTFEIAVRAGVAHTVRTIYDTTRFYLTRVWRAGQSAVDLRYDVDSAGRAKRMYGPFGLFGPQDEFTYSTDGMLTGDSRHGAWTISYQYRSGQDLARATYTPSSFQSSFGADFVQDTVGQILQQVNGSGTELENYGYDGRGRLTGFSRYSASPTCLPTDTLSEFGAPCTNGTTLLRSAAYTYDAAGNRTDNNAIVDASDRLVKFGNDTLLYDADGDLTRRYRLGDTTAFNQRLYWNSAGQLDSARTTRLNTTQMVKFGYDGFGRRVRKAVGPDTVWSIYTGSRLAAEYTDAGTQLRRYTYLPGMDNPHAVFEGGAWHYYLTDARGNVRGLVNQSGTTVEAEYKYLPFGDTVSTAGNVVNNLRFGGREVDGETGLYYNRARYYDPTVGRFVSEDASGLVPVNRYSYAGDEPVNGRDPDGRRCEPVAQMQAAPPVTPVNGAPTVPAATASASTNGWVCEDVTDEEAQWLAWGAHGNPPGWSPRGVYDALVAALGPSGGAGANGGLSGTQVGLILIPRRNSLSHFNRCRAFTVKFYTTGLMNGWLDAVTERWDLKRDGIPIPQPQEDGGTLLVARYEGTVVISSLTQNEVRKYDTHGDVECTTNNSVTMTLDREW